MALKTKVEAGEGQHEIVITRVFDLPLELLFKAFHERELFEEWMGSRVVAFDCRTHGHYAFETSDQHGNVVFRANGVFHQVVPGKRIIRTFEMENTPFSVQLEFLEFESVTDQTSQLTMHMIFKSAADRDNLLQLPFAQGLNMAHNRLQEVVSRLRS